MTDNNAPLPDINSNKMSSYLTAKDSGLLISWCKHSDQVRTGFSKLLCLITQFANLKKKKKGYVQTDASIRV